MSKIICDVCGTSYPETATQCPICGCARPGNIGALNDPAGGQQSSGEYQFVKGGRFSKANVKKRNQGKVYAPQSNDDDYRDGGSSNKGLIIAIILLLVAIIAVGAFITFKLISSDDNTTVPQSTGNGVSVVPTESTGTGGDTKPADIACEEINVNITNKTFSNEGDRILLNVEKTPKDTTDPVTFETTDDNVATVSDSGLITAVGYGEAVITVSCGDARATVNVVCTFNKPEDITDPTEPSVPVDPELTFEFETYTGELDIQFSYKGESVNIYSGTVPVDQIQWSSEDEEVATFKDGVVTATGKNKPGTSYIKIYAKYGDKEMECIVRCLDSVGEYTPPVVETPPPEEEPDYVISATELTLVVGQRETLELRDKNGELITVIWTVNVTGVCTVSGNQIYAAGEGNAQISTEHDGIPFFCNVTVVAAP